MDSRELEMAVQRDNYLIVPSYSEAMLLEPSSANAQVMKSFYNSIICTCNLFSMSFLVRYMPEN